MNAPSRGGILFSADHENQIKNIRLENLTVRHCTKNGVSLRGVSGIKIVNCDFSDNGSSVVPGPGFHHNLHLSHVKDCEITGSRLDDSLWGSGIDLSWGENVIVSDNEMARNKRSGIKYTESKNVSLTRNLMEGNEEPATGNNHAMHPEEQLDFVERQIKAQNEPYYAAYLQLIHFADSLLAIPHHALVDFAVPGFYDKPEEHRSNSLAIQCDAFGAYCSALAYRLSGEKKYGEKACYFLNAWANTNKRYSEHDGVLVMTYSGSALLIAAELMSETKLWEKGDKKAFEQWVSSVYQKAANEIRVHKNNWADWGRFGSLLAASFLDDREEIAENVRLIQSDLFDKIAPDGSMPEETRRGNNGIWYTYFSLAPMTAACWLVYNLTGEDLFVLEKNNISIKKALNSIAITTNIRTNGLGTHSRTPAKATSGRKTCWKQWPAFIRMRITKNV
jgi:parallel beta-helix repeat protein